MDFEWTNQTGPIDSRSPFISATQVQSQQQGSKHLDSPVKPNVTSYNGNFATPSRSGFFAGAASPASSLPAHLQQQTWEPRTPASACDFSSGGETPTTPLVESDAATPDTQLVGRMGRLAAGGDGEAKAGRRDGFKVFKDWLMGSPSPSKERREARNTHSYSHKTDGRIVKRRTERSDRGDRPRNKKRHAPTRSSDESDSGTPLAHENTAAASTASSAIHSPPKVVTAVQESVFERLGNFGHWLEAHPRLPAVLSYYLQFAVNSALGFCFLYLVYCAWSGIQSDVEIESSKHAAEVMVELSACALDYRRNHCGTSNMAPALENLCGVWETCMKRDPKKVARASVTAKTFAMIFNSFVEEFSYKSMIFTAIVLFGGFNLSNWAFGLLRQSSHHDPQQQQQQQQPSNEYMPQTPHRALAASYQQQHFDASYPPESPYSQPWHRLPQYPHQQQYQSLTPGRTGGEYARDANMRFIEPAPPLLHAQSMPAGALPTLSGGGSGSTESSAGGGGGRILRKRLLR